MANVESHELNPLVGSENSRLTKQVAQHFNHSAKTYHLGARLQRDVSIELFEEVVGINKIDVKLPLVLDLGAGPGLFTSTLQQVSEQLVSADLCGQMLRQNQSAKQPVQADSHQLPFVSNCFDLVYSSLMIQWCQMDTVLAEVYRALKPGGRAVISTLVKGTLTELQQAWSQVDNDKHIHDYLTYEQVEQLSTLQHWSDRQVNQQTKTYYFESAAALAKELKALGANLVKGRKNKGMMTKSKWAKMEQAYAQMAQSNGLPATYQLVYLELTK